jgi:hypothetical protein
MAIAHPWSSVNNCTLRVANKVLDVVKGKLCEDF